MNTKKCASCNSINIKELSNDNTVYGLVEINKPATVNIQKLIPVKVFVCKDCGHIELVHIQPDAIKD